jgi:broad specificity phosphatase PhoE
MAKTFVRLFLVRHGEAKANTEMRYLGSRDDPLTERGQWQVAQLAQALAPLPIAAIYTSPLRRAVDTAAAIAQGCGLTFTIDPRLIEGAFGDWEGLSRAEVIARGQPDADLLARWESDPACAPPGGESLEDIQSRALECVHELAAIHTGASIVLVSHVGVIKTLLCAAMGAPLSTARRMFLDVATISVVDWGAGAVVWQSQAVLRLFNAHHHLGWEAAKWMK